MKKPYDSLEDRQRIRAARYAKGKPPLTDEELEHLRAQGYVDAEGRMTPAGQLELHQLKLLEWMKHRPGRLYLWMEEEEIEQMLGIQPPKKIKRNRL